MLCNKQASSSVIAIQEVKPKHFRLEREKVEYKIDGHETNDENLLQEELGRGLLLYTY